MNKNFLSVATALLICASCTHKEAYVINGHITGNSTAIKDGYAYLVGVGIDVPPDTVKIKNGEFRFSSGSVVPGMRTITFKGLRGNIRIFLEEGEFFVSAADTALGKAVVKGGETQELFNLVQMRREEILPDNTYRTLRLESRLDGTSEARKKEITAQVRAAMDSLDRYSEDLVEQHPDSWFAVDYLLNRMSDIPHERLVRLSEGVMTSPMFDGSPDAETVREFVRNEENLQPGMPCPSMTMDTPSGKTVDFSEVFSSNELTMVYFWASWLKTAKERNSELNEVYSRYHGRGFEVIAVSLDRKERDWKWFVSKEKPCGVQVSDLRYWNSPAARTYNIRYLPQNLFVDGDGKIIGRKIEPGDIESFVSEHLK